MNAPTPELARHMRAIEESNRRDADPIVAELDNLRFARIAELGAINANLWATIGLAAERGEALTIERFYQVAAKATRETFALVRAIGTPEAANG